MAHLKKTKTNGYKNPLLYLLYHIKRSGGKLYFYIMHKKNYKKFIGAAMFDISCNFRRLLWTLKKI